MDPSHSVPELVATAQATAKISQDRVSEILEAMDGQTGSDAQIAELCAATATLEGTAVDLFSVFEARMQHHFRRGPFSRKLKALLLEAGQTDLADRVHQYYLAINVLKHGKGASYRELLAAPTDLVVLRTPTDISDDDADASMGLIDVSARGFFEGLSTTLLEAYDFLQNK